MGSSMSCATGAESMATIRTTARNLCVAVTHVRGEGKKRVHFTTRQANKYGNEQPRRGGGDHGKDQGGARERSANRPQAAQAASPPPRQAGIWCEYRVDGKFTFP